MRNTTTPGFRGELIGFTIKVVEAKSKGLVGLVGKVVGETMGMIVIQHDGREIKLLKDHILRLEVIGQGMVLSGKLIAGRPEERIKR